MKRRRMKNEGVCWPDSGHSRLRGNDGTAGFRLKGSVFTLAFAVILSALAFADETAAPRPNIVVIMADDMGFSDIGCYGGEIATPNLDRMAAEGLRFTQFYNNAKCSPTRASLLTGLYSQQCGVHNGPVIMRNCTTIAEVLGAAGYRAYMAGKWHSAELPTDRGFERYYGLADGCCNFFNPGEQRDGEAAPAEKNYPRRWSEDGKIMQPYTPEDPDFYATDAFTDHAIAYLDAHPRDEPFLLYLAYTAPHYPLQAPEEDIAKYRGKYLKGWDALRAERHARMIEMGIVDAKWPLSPRDPQVAAWTDVENRDAWDTEKLVTTKPNGLSWEDARDRDMWDLKMAVYAAMIDRMDQNIGRLLDTLDAMGVAENTLILFLADNGGCAELRNATPDVPPGPVDSYRTVDPPWAQAQNTPFRKYKRWDHEGGIATPLVARWPKTIAPNTITHQPGHLIDFMATFIEMADAHYPETFDGKPIPPVEGKSLLPVFRGEEREGHDTLCWQFSNSRAVRQGKWKLVQGDGPWELYDLEADRTELTDLAGQYPERVAAMKDAWSAWAKRCGALNAEKI